MKKSQNVNESLVPDPIWQEFVASGLVEKGITSLDIISSDNRLPQFSSDDANSALKVIKNSIKPVAYTRLHGRWRKFKFNRVHKIRTFSISEDTLNKLKYFAEKGGLEDDNFEVLLHYAMQADHEIKEAKTATLIADFPLPLNIKSQFQLNKAKLRFDPESWKFILALTEHAFNSGWSKCKSQHSKRRSEKHRELALESYFDAMRPDSKKT